MEVKQNEKKLEPRLLGEADAACIIGMSRQFLRKSRMNGTRKNHTPAPPWVQIGRSIRYKLDDLSAWIDAHRREPKEVQQ